MQEEERGDSCEQARAALTPLCPAGHLPHKGGDWRAATASSRGRSRVRGRGAVGLSARFKPISPLVGEMPGRAEGGRPDT
ncbi:lytic murein transglycosylase [Sinorhizobium fredii]|uniref:Lytic murein transglycosylase n=1 Tax=Rhizobium fredii TaxID=380 RepID=A0A2A6M298_RHIFR|nr:hypothetical protein SF83666_c38180 [Sinorhizobium fredii CCBAU 83666]PDT48632.1 lytic murein transglycosylase [Sinorhizobium fredii]